MPEISTNGVTLAYDERGEGPPIVLIMGLAAQSIFWPERFCDRLAGHGFRVIRFDNRDTGGSSSLDSLGLPNIPAVVLRKLVGLQITPPYTLSDMAVDTIGVLDALSVDRAHVVGVSLGGMIAQHVAIEHPTRVASMVSIMSSPGDFRSLVGVKPRALRVFLARAPVDRATYIERLVQTFRTNGSTGFPFDEAGMRELAGRAFDRGFHPNGIARQLTALLAAGDRTERLRNIAVPTLVLHGSDDPLVPVAGARAVADAIPGSRIEIIEGMGHDLPEAIWDRVVDGIAAHARGAT